MKNVQLIGQSLNPLPVTDITVFKVSHHWTYPINSFGQGLPSETNI